MCFNKTLFTITGHGPDLSQGQNLPVLSLGHFSLMLFKALPYTELKQSFCRQTRYHLHLTEEKIEAQRVANPHVIDRGRTPRQVWHLHHITESPTPSTCPIQQGGGPLPHLPAPRGTTQKHCHLAGCTLFSTSPCAGCNQAESAEGQPCPGEWEGLPPGFQPCPG